MFFEAFIIKIRIASYPFNIRSSSSPRVREVPFFLKLFKTPSVLISHYKVCKTTFSIYVNILNISSNVLFTLHIIWTFVSFLWSYRIWAYLQKINIKKNLIFFGGIKESKRRQEQKDKQIFQFTLLSLVSDLFLSLFISPYLQVRTDGKS